MIFIFVRLLLISLIFFLQCEIAVKSKNNKFVSQQFREFAASVLEHHRKVKDWQRKKQLISRECRSNTKLTIFVVNLHIKMDKLTTISATLFMAADIFAIISLAMPDWIVTDVGGKFHYLFIDPIWLCCCLCAFPLIDLKTGSSYGLYIGETRLGLMWTCMTLYNRPQVCFTPELQPEWLLALICIFVGCICITTTIILLASSNWDRDVIPYARWVGFTASKNRIVYTIQRALSVCRPKKKTNFFFRFVVGHARAQWCCFVWRP